MQQENLIDFNNQKQKQYSDESNPSNQNHHQQNDSQDVEEIKAVSLMEKSSQEIENILENSAKKTVENQQQKQSQKQSQPPNQSNDQNLKKKRSDIFKNSDNHFFNKEIPRKYKDLYFQEIIEIINSFDWKKGKLMDLNNKIDLLKESYLQNIQKEIIQELKKTVKDDQQIEELRKIDINVAQDFFKNLIFTHSNPYQSILNLVSRNVKRLLKMYMLQLENNKPPKRQEMIQELRNTIFELKICPKISDDVENQIKENIFQDFQVLIFALTQIPLVYIIFFEEDFVAQLQNTTQIDSKSVDLDNFKQYLYFKFLNKLKEIIPNAEFYIRINPQLLIDFIAFMNSKIVSFYNNIQQKIQEEIEHFTEKTKEIAIANKYLLVGLLRELSFKIHDTVLLNLESTYFSLIDPNYVQKFAKYIIQNHDSFVLSSSSKIQSLNKMENPQEVILLEEIEKQKAKQQNDMEVQDELAHKLGLIANKTEKIQVTQIVNLDNKPGLHVQSEKGEFIVHSNREGELVVVNTQFVKEKWYKIDQTVEEEMEKEKVKNSKKVTRYDEKLESVAKNKPLGKFISEGHLSTKPSPNLQEHATYYGTASDLGSSLGYCLANIKNYNNPQEFLLEFGYISAMNGSVTYLVQKVPIFGPILLLGGMGWTSLKMYHNKTANAKTKLQQASKLVLNTGTAIGGGISGAFIGQAVIPVPVLGALVGGVIGGFVGTQASSMLIQQLNKQKYQNMVKQIASQMEPQGYWEYTRQNLDILGITNQFFVSEIPKDLKLMCGEQHGDVWITMTVYCLMTLYHAQQEQAQQEKNKDKKLQQEQQEQEVLLEKSKQNPDLKNYMQQDISEVQKLENEEQKIAQRLVNSSPNSSQKEQQQQQKKNNNNNILNNNNNDDDDTINWPQTIVLPQKWLINQQIQVGWYLDQLSQFLKKIMAQG